MKQWNNLTTEERFQSWRDLRDSLSGKSDIEVMDGVASFCFSFPISKRVLDYYTPATWPTPWEILNGKETCRSTAALFIFYTLKMIKPSMDCKLVLIDDDSDRYLIVIVNGDIIINYELGKTTKYSTLKKHINIVDSISEGDIKSIH